MSRQTSPPENRPWCSQQAVVAGSIAAVASAIALAIAGRRELRDPAAPLNGPSQWLWGRPASFRRGFSVRHTVAGYLVHHIASVFWATLYERFCSHGVSKGGSAVGAAATAALACVVDMKLAPGRLTPGFERRLSRPALLAVYAAFACGLAASRLRSRK
jgi:hypothetical protein